MMLMKLASDNLSLKKEIRLPIQLVDLVHRQCDQLGCTPSEFYRTAIDIVCLPEYSVWQWPDTYRDEKERKRITLRISEQQSEDYRNAMSLYGNRSGIRMIRRCIEKLAADPVKYRNIEDLRHEWIEKRKEDLVSLQLSI